MKLAYCFVALLFLSSCTQIANVNTGELEAAQPIITLHVDPGSVQKERAEFAGKLRVMAKAKDKRSLYEEYVDLIGANGILDGINEVFVQCHVEAHDLGKIIFAKTKDIGASLRICSDSCNTGCMHGVLMEAFSKAKGDDEDGHIDMNKLLPMLNDLCYNNAEMKSYGPGECAHAVGHAMMFLSDYRIQTALDACASFADKKMEYYCADGGYMEYLVEQDSEDAKTESLFYPCDTFAYPATCMRTKVGFVGKRMFDAGKTTSDIIDACEKLEGKVRLGCFHGLGTSHAKIVKIGKMRINELCSHGSPDEQTACIEGAVEFIGKYYPDSVQTVCSDLDGEKHETCLAAGKHKLYSLDKDLTLYLG